MRDIFPPLRRNTLHYTLNHKFLYCFGTMSILLSRTAIKLIAKGFHWQLSPTINVNNCSKVISSLPTSCHLPSGRYYSEKRDVSVRKEDSELQTDVKVTVKEATKTASYSAVILLGVGVTAALLYAVFRELFSKKSPSGVYSDAFKICSEDTRVQDSLGTPIKGFGEETRRGRRRHVNHVSYLKDDVPHMRMQFYLKGCRNSGTVHLEVKENARGDHEYRYLFVQLDDLSRRVIVLEDNRAKEEAAKSFLTPLDDYNTLK